MGVLLHCIVNILYKYISDELLIQAEITKVCSKYPVQDFCFGNYLCSRYMRGAGGRGIQKLQLVLFTPQRIFLSFFHLFWLCHKLKYLECCIARGLLEFNQ